MSRRSEWIHHQNLAIGAEHAVKIGVGVCEETAVCEQCTPLQVCFEYLALFVWRGIISVKVQTRFANGDNFRIGQQGLQVVEVCC